MEQQKINGLSADQMWRIWESQDAAYDGQFFVAVKTTKVYCRISCPGRPLRKNVVFYASCDAAEAAGFRACKRCHPREALLPDNAAALAQRAAALIGDSGRARLHELSAQLNVSPFHLQRTFKKVMGVSPLQYAKAHRASAIKKELQNGHRVTDAIYNAGFASSSRAYEDGVLGMTPTRYKQGGAGMHIGFTVLSSPLGRMLVAATAKGICAIHFGDEGQEADTQLQSALMREFPNAAIQAHMASGAQSWADAVLAVLQKQRPHESLRKLPLDIQGTAFQARVWQALRDIPCGQTRSYTEVAQAIGKPAAMRAVANACGANPVAVVIPCHRVVREDGSVGGYHWGAARKAQLLAAEKD
jgi:AraC family transcriptional regulator of adaptative response/methylated-DNA-[protein]-cysteine methyltransferase